MVRALGSAAALAWLTVAVGCESNYIYRPAENATADVAGRTAAYYPLPPGEAQRGDLRIASFGISKVNGANLPKDTRALHVRVVISNDSALGWTFDTSEQIAELRSGGRLKPAFVQTDRGMAPAVTIEPNGKRTVDLFYLLPVGMAKASKIPEFDVLWRVRAGERVIAQRTPFERLRIYPYYAGPGWYGGGFGWGPYGWYDPFWGPATLGVPGWYW